MKKIVLGLMLPLFAQCAVAQTMDSIDCDFWWPDDEQVMWGVPEQMPNFPGGETALMKYISEHLVYPQEAKDAGVEGRMLDFINGNLEYPQEAKDAEIEGKVFVSFIVEKDGSLSSIKLLRGIGYGCDEAAMDVVRKMPKWKPAIQRGKPVRVQYQLPFNFKLENEKQK